MKVATLGQSETGHWHTQGEQVSDPQLVLWFASPAQASRAELFDGLRALYPNATIAGCTTSGEVHNGDVLEGSAVATAIRFREAQIRTAQLDFATDDEAHDAGLRLGAMLPVADLRAVFLLVDGPSQSVLVLRGLIAGLPPGLPVSGGVAGGLETSSPSGVGLNAPPRGGTAVAIGFYGASLRIGYGAGSGWDPLGPARRVTRSRGNVLYELDGQPALDLYLRFIGETTDGVRLAALRYPFVFKASTDAVQDVIRTLHDFDEVERSLTFVDEVPQGLIAQMMRSTPDHLIDGGIQAARHASAQTDDQSSLALVVSCIGRKLVMGQSVTDEIFAMYEELAEQPMAGFFSYGEICPHNGSGQCTLFNEAVTLTLIGEAG